MFGKMKEMLEAQKKMGTIKKALEKITMENQRHNGDVKVVMTGTQKLVSIEISEALLKPEKKELLQRVLRDCINETADKVQRSAAQQLKGEMGDLNIPGL
ncbi:MAG: hypothetical protein DRP78_06580 [Candidatus Omnitrophota bacterium]|nr:MAG: hypothetical protein DRP78_06580 [Candidatus Omnitrophota bacterium]